MYSFKNHIVHIPRKMPVLRYMPILRYFYFNNTDISMKNKMNVQKEFAKLDICFFSTYIRKKSKIKIVWKQPL